MTYARSNPSPRYRAMLDLYARLHQEGERGRGLAPQETYPGVNLLPHAKRIKGLIDDTQATTVLDYGAGKGIAYDLSPVTVPGVGTVETLVDYWDVDSVHCYDPCHPPFSTLPQGTFDGVVATDVLEHCPEEDVPWIVAELFAFARRFVFASIASYPARTHLPNGENAHCTIRPPQWWADLFAAASAARPGPRWRICVQSVVEREGGHGIAEHEFGGGDVPA